jgi:hypothetical protein
VMAWTMRSCATGARCERPSDDRSRRCADHPGRLAAGPDEKRGSAGRRLGGDKGMVISQAIARNLPQLFLLFNKYNRAATKAVCVSRT